MAALSNVNVVPNPVPSGQTATVSLSFTTAPATPDLTADITVYENGAARGTANGVVLTGTPAEPTPNTQVGATNVGWEVRTTVGTLTRTSQNTFTLSR